MLRVANLLVGYGGRPVVGLPSLTVPAGEGHLLLGPSGSGKTTLLMAMAGLAQVLAGQIEIDGARLPPARSAELDRFRGRAVGVVFQDLNLVAGLTAMQNLLLAPFAASAPQDRRRAAELLDALGVGDAARRQVQTLSRGQAQRVAIARAMIMKPKVILADEPTASLDVDNCRTVAGLLRSAARETGAALLIATHDERLTSLFDGQTHVGSAP